MSQRQLAVPQQAPLPNNAPQLDQQAYQSPLAFLTQQVEQPVAAAKAPPPQMLQLNNSLLRTKAVNESNRQMAQPPAPT